MCKVGGKRPPSFYIGKKSSDADMIIDNKKFEIPTTEKARSYMAQQQVRFHLRTQSEGVKPECVKPCRKKNKMNTGAYANVCGGIVNGRIAMWEYLPKRWNGDVATALYKGAIIKTLRRRRGVKRTYKLIEDNDPTGYKSSKGKGAKKELGIKAVPMPRYSPDLNPLDFSLWSLIERKMIEGTPKKVESVDQYKARLRRTAFGLPKSVVTRAVSSMPKRMRAVVAAKGHCTQKD